MYSSTQYSNTAQHKKIEESEEQVITCTPKINIQLPNIKSLMKQKNKENKWRSALKITCIRKINVLKLSNTWKIAETKEKGKEMAKCIERMITCTCKTNILIRSVRKRLMKQKKKKKKWRSALNEWSPVPVKSIFLNCPMPKKLMRQEKTEE